MNIKNVNATLLESARFTRKLKAARDRLLQDPIASISGSKETAAARRASMDLTRSLAELRKP